MPTSKSVGTVRLEATIADLTIDGNLARKRQNQALFCQFERNGVVSANYVLKCRPGGAPLSIFSICKLVEFVHRAYRSVSIAGLTLRVAAGQGNIVFGIGGAFTDSTS